ncbi:class I SAM-dependent methyltransferase [Paenibacillus sp. FSL K6-2524]|uniref:class I SAM-dependent methyltransferase n=1 Tax=Paenibacillus sp. FSL K6-2524 TaxID=2954516 RepID=UPI0030FA5B3B
MSEVVRNYYENNAEYEWERLNNPYSKVEFLSTIRLFEKYLPVTGHVCDVGSGPGRYSTWLLKQGYKVTLFEISQKELDIAASRILELGLQAEAYICDNATNMHVLSDETYDAVLVMGPLYHILDDCDRTKIIRDTSRILKKGGVAIFAYINSWGALKAGVTEFSEEFRDLNHLYKYLGELKLDENQGFTECYFSTPVKALEEITQGGFEIVSYAGTESFLAGMRPEITRLYKEDRVVYDHLLQVASESSELPQYRDATEHLHIVARKK